MQPHLHRKPEGSGEWFVEVCAIWVALDPSEDHTRRAK